MLNKLLTGWFVYFVVLPFVKKRTRNFRTAFKMGWNDQYDRQAAEGIFPPRPFNHKFKNV